MSGWSKRAPLVVPLMALVAACSGSSSSSAPTDTVPAACQDIAVDRFKSLAIVDDAVVNDPRASNATDGPWSFRHAVEEMTPPGMTPSQFVYAWLNTWLQTANVNNFKVEVRQAMRTKLLCPWLQRTPSNQCDDLCYNCAATELDLSLAPYRLIGMANRMDLRETEAPGTAGEGRLAFAVLDGPATDPASQPLKGTVIFEYELPLTNGRTPKDWAERWRKLSDHAAFDADYLADLQDLTDSFVTRGSNPDGVGGSAIHQVRTNEREFDWQWDLREYKLSPTGLKLSPVFRSPDASIYDDPALSQWVSSNTDAILKRQYTTPPNLTGGQSQPLKAIRLPGIGEDVRKVFASETCAGCHQLENPSIDINFHYSPARSGVAKLSTFLNDPAHQDTDELAHRTRSLRRGLCGE